jgi:glyoxylase-like metal-dependent hydrolase (beta-lactamase superfamily II)
MAVSERSWEELGEGVFTRRYRFFDQQIGVVVGDDAVAVVDTRSTFRQAEEIKRDIAALTTKPVTTVINTHGHYDHAFGNRVFRPAAIWGHVRCASMLELTGERQRAGFIDEQPSMADEANEVVIDPPDRLFDTEATIDVGGRRVELRYLGRGHTDNDIVVSVPEARILFAGDLIEQGAVPFFGDGYPLEWPDTVERMLTILPEMVVPGHGQIGDRAFVESQLEAFRQIADLARRIHGGELDFHAAASAAPYPAVEAREPLTRALAQLRGEI